MDYRMDILIAVPMHNYAEGVIRQLVWASQSSVLRMHDWSLVVLDDHSGDAQAKAVQWAIAEHPKIDTKRCLYLPGGAGLRGSLRTAARLGDAHDVVLIVESDCAPCGDTLHAIGS